MAEVFTTCVIEGRRFTTNAFRKCVCNFGVAFKICEAVDVCLVFASLRNVSEAENLHFDEVGASAAMTRLVIAAHTLKES